MRVPSAPMMPNAAARSRGRRKGLWMAAAPRALPAICFRCAARDGATRALDRQFMNHILIESLSAAAAARAAGFQSPIHWHTSSPGVIEALRASGESADWIEDCVERDLCEKVARVTGQAVEMLAQEFSPAAIDLDIPCMMANAARQIYLLAGTLLYKQALLSPWMKKYPTGVVVGDPHLTANENGNIGCHPFDTLFACLAAHPANGLRVIVHRAARPKLSEFKDVPSALTRLLSWADLSFDQ